MLLIFRTNEICNIASPVNHGSFHHWYKILARKTPPPSPKNTRWKRISVEINIVKALVGERKDYITRRMCYLIKSSVVEAPRRWSGCFFSLPFFIQLFFCWFGDSNETIYRSDSFLYFHSLPAFSLKVLSLKRENISWPFVRVKSVK